MDKGGTPDPKRIKPCSSKLTVDDVSLAPKQKIKCDCAVCASQARKAKMDKIIAKN